MKKVYHKCALRTKFIDQDDLSHLRTRANERADIVVLKILHLKQQQLSTMWHKNTPPAKCNFWTVWVFILKVSRLYRPVPAAILNFKHFKINTSSCWKMKPDGKTDSAVLDKFQLLCLNRSLAFTLALSRMKFNLIFPTKRQPLKPWRRHACTHWLKIGLLPTPANSLVKMKGIQTRLTPSSWTTMSGELRYTIYISTQTEIHRRSQFLKLTEERLTQDTVNENSSGFCECWWWTLWT